MPHTGRNEKKEGVWLNLILALTFLLLVVTVFFTVFRLNNPDMDFAVLGFRPLVIKTNSMEPTIRTGALVLARKTDFDQVEVKDIITFIRQDGSLNTHRVIQKNAEEGILFTKGDNSDYPDNVEISPGNYRYKIVMVMNWTTHLKTTSGVLLFVVAPLIGLSMLVFLFSLLKRRKRQNEELLLDENAYEYLSEDQDTVPDGLIADQTDSHGDVPMDQPQTSSQWFPIVDQKEAQPVQQQPAPVFQQPVQQPVQQQSAWFAEQQPAPVFQQPAQQPVQQQPAPAFQQPAQQPVQQQSAWFAEQQPATVFQQPAQQPVQQPAPAFQQPVQQPVQQQSPPVFQQPAQQPMQQQSAWFAEQQPATPWVPQQQPFQAPQPTPRQQENDWMDEILRDLDVSDVDLSSDMLKDIKLDDFD